MVSRRVLGMASAALLGEAALDRPIMQLGTTLLGDPTGVPLLEGSSESLGTLGKHDVPWGRAITDQLWTLDLEYGGASILSAASGTAVQVVGALRNSPPNRELLLAASHLCRVAGWTAFDAGRKRKSHCEKLLTPWIGAFSGRRTRRIARSLPRTRSCVCGTPKGQTLSTQQRCSDT